MNVVKKWKRFTVRRTEHHGDKCWGVFDTLEQRYTMRDTIKRHCIIEAAKLNRNPPIHNVNPSGIATIRWFI